MAAAIQSTTVRWLSCSRSRPAIRGPTISSASRKPLNSRLCAIWTGTRVRSTWTSEPSLRRAAASRCPPAGGMDPGMASVSSSPRPTMALAGQPNTASAGRLHRVMQPLRSVSTKRASTSWRSSSSTASGGATASKVIDFLDTRSAIGSERPRHNPKPSV